MTNRDEAAKHEGLGKTVALTVIGFAVLAVCAILSKMARGAEGALLTLPYLGIGIGAGIFGQNFGALMRRRMLRNDPATAKRLAIEERDERNTTIRNRAKAKAYDLTVYAFGALMLAFALTQVDLYATLALVVVYLFVVSANIYYLNRFQKEM